jgi:hypothetical protein
MALEGCRWRVYGMRMDFARWGDAGAIRNMWSVLLKSIETWIRVRRIDLLERRDKIDRLTSMPQDELKLTIDDLGFGAAMAQDVRARVSCL